MIERSMQTCGPGAGTSVERGARHARQHRYDHPTPERTR